MKDKDLSVLHGGDGNLQLLPAALLEIFSENTTPTYSLLL